MTVEILKRKKKKMFLLGVEDWLVGLMADWGYTVNYIYAKDIIMTKMSLLYLHTP